ncbi:MAG: very short patch repair endonuclease [Pseudomonadota bacterium]|nr:very short patch repair endonuclease [Pseudomonadota bacterium]
MPSISDSRPSKGRVSPSYKDCRPATPQASRVKQRNRKKDTGAELALRRELWKRGLRYRLHAEHLAGKPDIFFPKRKVAIFVDGDFWHGRDWAARKEKLSKGANADYWMRKISYNRERDRKNDAQLARTGWLVARFWETDVKKDVGYCADRIASLLADTRG